MRLLANGRLLDQRSGGAQGEHAWAMTPEQADWAVVEIRGAAGDLLAITNPIYLQHSRRG